MADGIDLYSLHGGLPTGKVIALECPRKKVT